MITLVLDKIELIRESVTSYITYQELKPLYERLTEEERIYIHSLHNVKKCLDSKFDVANNELYNELIYEHIGRFESKNRCITFNKKV